MNPDFLPALQDALRTLGEIAARHDVTDATLAEVGAELDRARTALAGVRGTHLANRCARHPGGPVDPTADNGCLFCGTAARRPAAPPPADVPAGEVLRVLAEHGPDAAAARFGGQAVARAVAAARHPSNFRPAIPGGPDHPTTEGHDQP